jgi:hypothetical protein
MLAGRLSSAESPRANDFLNPAGSSPSSFEALTPLAAQPSPRCQQAAKACGMMETVKFSRSDG